nr:uncharacterized protein LOC109733608 isoform X1 [Aegilops tauschii subsp. strangulata]XP_040242895.1 uncharacterized protein LOC109733608 isoform X1 [Aegilops tauschii subsp. strangulata]XP_040242896.1 uncharacterized protein LOC109733608 isoform X1 [Aegilops tauschii subsp. strangulata]XP_040242897.1 uncharacterized protein LOC109733608 isoform X1 [Aegilops tauschii subsp. strangulata]
MRPPLPSSLPAPRLLQPCSPATTAVQSAPVAVQLGQVRKRIEVPCSCACCSMNTTALQLLDGGLRKVRGSSDVLRWPSPSLCVARCLIPDTGGAKRGGEGGNLPLRLCLSSRIDSLEGIQRECPDSYNSKERIGDCRVALGSSDIQDGLVNLVPCQKQDLVAFRFIKPAQLEKIYAPETPNSLLQGTEKIINVGLCSRILKHVSDVGEECMKSPLYFSVLLLSQH